MALRFLEALKRDTPKRSSCQTIEQVASSPSCSESACRTLSFGCDLIGSDRTFVSSR
jgi:hypothetical protein